MSEGDELCEICIEKDLFSLFTGPRYSVGGFDQKCPHQMGTLQQVKNNERCPLCRLIKHDVYSDWTPQYGKNSDAGCDLTKIWCILYPLRIDYTEDTKYVGDRTKEMLATRVEIRLKAAEDSSQKEESFAQRHLSGPGILLLSPESVDPARPLLNGFRAGSVQNGLLKLSEWMRTCHQHHKECNHLESNKGSALEPSQIRVIDVRERKLVDRDITTVTYAALSYVWGQGHRQYSKLASNLRVGEDGVVYLPTAAPQVVEDAINVCMALSIPYLWADLYCLHQDDPDLKAAEIKAMGSIYRRSHITLVVGLVASRVKTDVAFEDRGFLHRPTTDDVGSAQRIETIANRRYISALPSITRQIQGSEWCSRGWTFQEGQMARRVAFFGNYDVSFMCGAGHWRESLHSGEFGHDVNITGVDLRSNGYYVLSAFMWLRSSEWDFSDYDAVALAYSQRRLSYESDRLDAISGCFNMVAQKKGIHFISGLPSADFHYALLFHGENDRFRAGFPSWSWAGWYAVNQMHFIYPKASASLVLTQTEDGEFEYRGPDAPDGELEGVLLRPTLESPHRVNKCAQKLATLEVSESRGTLTITSEAARFFVDIEPALGTPLYGTGEWSERMSSPDFDTTSGHFATHWAPEVEYNKPYQRLRLRDSSGNTYKELHRWTNHGPVVLVELPMTLRGSTLTWLLRDGIELIRIVEIKFLEGHEKMKPFHHVLCLGIDRSEGIPGQGRRMGMFCIPKEAWDKAEPREMEVTFR